MGLEVAHPLRQDASTVGHERKVKRYRLAGTYHQVAPVGGVVVLVGRGHQWRTGEFGVELRDGVGAIDEDLRADLRLAELRRLAGRELLQFDGAAVGGGDDERDVVALAAGQPPVVAAQDDHACVEAFGVHVTGPVVEREPQRLGAGQFGRLVRSRARPGRPRNRRRGPAVDAAGVFPLGLGGQAIRLVLFRTEPFAERHRVMPTDPRGPAAALDDVTGPEELVLSQRDLAPRDDQRLAQRYFVDGAFVPVTVCRAHRKRTGGKLDKLNAAGTCRPRCRHTQTAYEDDRAHRRRHCSHRRTPSCCPTRSYLESLAPFAPDAPLASSAFTPGSTRYTTFLSAARVFL